MLSASLSGLLTHGTAPLLAAANSGFGLATAVMVLLVASLLYALVVVVLSTSGRRAPVLPEDADWAIPVLSVIGLGVAFYLTYVETQKVQAVCGPVGDCNSVQASPYARILGVLPVGLVGAAGYVAILAAWAWARFGRGRLAELAPLAIFAMALFGVLFSIYLTYLELEIILAVCIWCLSSAFVMTLLLALSSRAAAEALTVDEE